MSSFRELFPFFTHCNEVYLDSAATSHRLNACSQDMQAYYDCYNANVHRGAYQSARKASNKYEEARQEIRYFLGARNASEIVFTSGATDAINLIANGLNIKDLHGKEILLFESEHHANLLPWQNFAKKHNLTLKKISLGKNASFDQDLFNVAIKNINENVAILAIAHVSNALGNVNPITLLCEKAASVGVLSVIDGTQAAAHIKIDVAEIGCDFYAISGHKMYAGTGIGALYGKKTWLEKLSPSKLGGEMIRSVTWENFELQDAPGKFEAGTPNIAGAIGMASAAKFLRKNISKIESHEQALVAYVLEKLYPLIETKQIVILGNIGAEQTKRVFPSIALISFYSPIIHANDIASYLSSKGIALRAGHHCAMPLMQSIGIEGCARLSIGCYTNTDDIDMFVAAIYELFYFLKEGTKAPKSDGASPLRSNDNKLIGDDIAQARDWSAKHRLLLLNSKKLPMLAQEQCDASTEIGGCEAKVWLSLSNPQESYQGLRGSSQSKVIRGILALIIDKVNALSRNELEGFDFTAYLHEIGLANYFSEGRRDGVHQIIKRIKLLYQLEQ